MRKQWRQIRLRAVPWFKSLLCFDFFGRLLIFGGLTYFIGCQAHGMNKERVTLHQEGMESPNRFSKTFGREKALDKLLSTADDSELLANLGKEEENNSSNVDHSKKV